METKTLKINILQHILTVEAPYQMDCKNDSIIWENVKRSCLRIMTSRCRIHAIAVNPPECPESYFCLLGIPCKQFQLMECKCFVLSPDIWTDEMITDMADSMSFELGHLWFFRSSNEDDIEILNNIVSTIHKCQINNGELLHCKAELFGNVNDNTSLTYVNWKEGQKDRLIENIKKEVQSNWIIIGEEKNIFLYKNIIDLVYIITTVA